MKARQPLVGLSHNRGTVLLDVNQTGIACREAREVRQGRAVRFTRRLHHQLRRQLCHRPRRRREDRRPRDQMTQSYPFISLA